MLLVTSLQLILISYALVFLVLFQIGEVIYDRTLHHVICNSWEILRIWSDVINIIVALLVIINLGVVRVEAALIIVSIVKWILLTYIWSWFIILIIIRDIHVIEILIIKIRFILIEVIIIIIILHHILIVTWSIWRFLVKVRVVIIHPIIPHKLIELFLVLRLSTVISEITVRLINVRNWRYFSWYLLSTSQQRLLLLILVWILFHQLVFVSSLGKVIFVGLFIFILVVIIFISIALIVFIIPIILLVLIIHIIWLLVVIVIIFIFLLFLSILISIVLLLVLLSYFILSKFWSLNYSSLSMVFTLFLNHKFYIMIEFPLERFFLLPNFLFDSRSYTLEVCRLLFLLCLLILLF